MPEADRKRAMITPLRFLGACEYANSRPADKETVEKYITVDFYKFPSWKYMEISHVEKAGDVRHR